jgi:hypothetical protein
MRTTMAGSTLGVPHEIDSNHVSVVRYLILHSIFPKEERPAFECDLACCCGFEISFEDVGRLRHIGQA